MTIDRNNQGKTITWPWDHTMKLFLLNYDCTPEKKKNDMDSRTEPVNITYKSPGISSRYAG